MIVFLVCLTRGSSRFLQATKNPPSWEPCTGEAQHLLSYFWGLFSAWRLRCPTSHPNEPSLCICNSIKKKTNKQKQSVSYNLSILKHLKMESKCWKASRKKTGSSPECFPCSIYLCFFKVWQLGACLGYFSGSVGVLLCFCFVWRSHAELYKAYFWLYAQGHSMWSLGDLKGWRDISNPACLHARYVSSLYPLFRPSLWLILFILQFHLYCSKLYDFIFTYSCIFFHCNFHTTTLFISNYKFIYNK